MIPYNQVDKTEWIQMDIDLDHDLAERVKALADYEQIDVNDFISKCLYEWWQTELKKEQKESADESGVT